ncbi:MAG: archease [Candidatus Marsarchaeota archaeon]|nr:archease [Candidatus Marsarchaeota archaeon]
MRRYIYKNHTADVEFVAYGRTLSELFSNALLAMSGVNADTDMLSKTEGKKIWLRVKDKAPSIETLLWYFLQDILSLSDAKGVYTYMAEEVDVRKRASGFSFEASLISKHKYPEVSKLDIKGVSMYALSISKTANGFKANVVLDV